MAYVAWKIEALKQVKGKHRGRIQLLQSYSLSSGCSCNLSKISLELLTQPVPLVIWTSCGCTLPMASLQE